MAVSAAGMLLVGCCEMRTDIAGLFRCVVRCLSVVLALQTIKSLNLCNVTRKQVFYYYM